MKSNLGTKPGIGMARFFAFISLVAILAGRTALAAESFTPDQTTAIEKIVREYILKNPEIILDAVDAIRKKQEADKGERTRQNILAKKEEIFRDPASPVGGNPRGDVTVVEFFDYQCGFCKKVYPTLQKLLADDVGIRFVYKEFPILGPNSVFAARAALAAWRQDKNKYVTFHKVMMASKGTLTEAAVFRFAKDAGLDVERLTRDLKDDEINKIIRRNLELASALSINGTPAFIIGDTLIPGAVSLGTLRSMVDRARKSGFADLL